MAQSLSQSVTQTAVLHPFKHTDDACAPHYWDEACEFLLKHHSAWKPLIVRYRGRALRSRGDAFQTLAKAITGQQISVKAADTIWARVAALFADDTATSTATLALSADKLRAAGLSARKVDYIRSLAQFAVEGGLEPRLLDAMADEVCLKHLIQVKGIGRWTAEMFLIFNLRRADVWPVDDLGLIKALGLQLVGQDVGSPIAPAPLDARLAIQLGETLRPWRTVATWYLWRSLDPIVVDY